MMSEITQINICVIFFESFNSVANRIILESTIRYINPISAGLFLAFYDPGGGIHPPLENNVTVELGR